MAIALAVVVLPAGACFQGDGCSFESLTCTEQAGRSATGAAPVEAPATEGRVYLDLSTSMRGFIADERSPISFTPMQKALDHLLAEGFAEAEISEVQHDGFGETIRRNIGPLQFYSVRAPGGPSPRERFAEPSTDLLQVFRDAAAHQDAVSVIVTDGAQDLRRSGTGGVGPGFIRTEMVREVKHEVIDRGFGLWLVAVMSAFDGCYFNVNPDSQGRVNQCVRVKIRPVFFWLVSRDLLAGRRLVTVLVEGLGGLPRPFEGDTVEPEVQALELWPGAVMTPEVEVTRGTELGRDFFADNLYVGARAPSASLTAPPGVTAACVSFEQRPGGFLRIPLVLRSRTEHEDAPAIPGPPASLWQAVAPEATVWRLVEHRREISDSSPSGEVAPTPDLAGGEATWVLELPYEVAARLAAENRSLELPFRRRLQLDRGPESSWLRRWSSDDDSTASAIEGKALYLWDVVGGIVKATADEREPVACLHLKFRRR